MVGVPWDNTGQETDKARHESRLRVDNTYTQTVLRKVLTVFLTHPQQLTEHEQRIAERICACSLCDVLWLRRKKRSPQRCAHCHRHAWNRPLLESIRAIEAAQLAAAANKSKEAK